MADKLETEFVRDTLLQGLDVGVRELDDAPALDIDEVIVMLARCRLVAPAAVAEIMPLQNALPGEKLERAVDRRERNSRIDRVGTPVNFFDVGMIGGGG